MVNGMGTTTYFQLNLRQIFRSERRNIALFYLLTVAMNFWFITSNWVYFWNKYMTYGQIGWVDVVGFSFSIFLEIPSGAIADLLGKRRTIFVGFFSGAIGVSILTFSGSLWGMFVGWLITQLCFAFYSGAAEALAYDTLVDLKEEQNYDKVISKSNEIESYTGAITTFMGGYLYAINFRLPHILWGTSFLMGAILAWFLIEPKVDTFTFSFKTYLKQFGMGFKVLFQPPLRTYMGYFIALVAVYFLYSWSFIRPAMADSFGFKAKEQGLVIASITIYGAIIVRSLPYLKKRISDAKGLLILSILMVLGFYLASFPIGIFGLIPMFLIATAGKMASPWISIIINKRIESKYRATTLSTLAMITKIPYVLVVVIAGKMIENAELGELSLGISIVILIVVIFSSVMLLIEKSKNWLLNQ